MHSNNTSAVYQIQYQLEQNGDKWAGLIILNCFIGILSGLGIPEVILLLNFIVVFYKKTKNAFIKFLFNNNIILIKI